ncbi:MAG: biotin transporter BioY [Candidatus Algichlamydia australiensis]|nr:biotin transporter BioY [Chlamydiales bacterium]
MIKTLAQIKNKTFAKDAILVVGASLLIGLSAKVHIPLGFTPIPLAIRSQLILFLALFLGPKRAALATAGFLLQGIAGLPVFMGAGLTGPMAGYLLGYVGAAYITGKLAESSTTYKQNFIAMGVGALVIYLFGVIGLTPYVGSVQKAVLLGVLPFLPGDLLKLVLATKISQLRLKF